MSQFLTQLGDAATAVEAFLAECLAEQQANGTPPRLAEALRHAVLAGGKRFRPFLVFESAKLFGVTREAALPAAAALECIHCYSLVHDDLPAMDNDELRRGRPTVWKAYDEWTAILVGDALQAFAFELISEPGRHEDAEVRAGLTHTLAVASGAIGMVGGQMLDLDAGRLPEQPAATIADIMRLQSMKTGCLITAACEMGAILGRATASDKAALKTYGEHLGSAFQISDDLLDAEGTAADVGKATGKDAAAGKATLIGLLGIPEAREHLDRSIDAATAALHAFGTKAEPLIEAARHMGRRGS
ncbi:polyprenyl synthetase [Hyphomicrobium denitrificans 1NES1]|uniref:Probable farnesyl diphosphate synthase n=1 Tax=Hyphomicrobium denitrificans 1NES1 TaxID=670307 RepID=N0BFG6_9HYPH|nr:farnesyl diphosphate synthase [Hyphomicrobium denitrificans]AGK59201.1 polyprenyl synthetase [Hyphomicrobium denitrificans 1NES1]